MSSGHVGHRNISIDPGDICRVPRQPGQADVNQALLVEADRGVPHPDKIDARVNVLKVKCPIAKGALNQGETDTGRKLLLAERLGQTDAGGKSQRVGDDSHNMKL